MSLIRFTARLHTVYINKVALTYPTPIDLGNEQCSKLESLVDISIPFEKQLSLSRTVHIIAFVCTWAVPVKLTDLYGATHALQ